MALGIESGAIATQFGFFVRTLGWGLVVLAIIGSFYYMSFLNYIVELNKKTGSGYLVVRYKARRIKDKDGLLKLKIFRGPKYIYPKDNSFIYKQGKKFLVRFIEYGDANYHPMLINEETKSLDTVPQSIRFLFKNEQAEIKAKYEQKQSLLQQWGPILGMAVAAVVFIFVVYYSIESIKEAMELGRSVIEQTAQCKNVLMSGGGAPPV